MSESIQNLQTFDPFADTIDENDQVSTVTQQQVHLRIQKRTGRKAITTVQGLPKKIDWKLLLKAFKKEFCCNGTIIKDEETGEKIIQLAGDQRRSVAKFIVEEGIVSSSNVIIHGY